MVLPYDTMTTTTLQLIRKRMADNIFKANPTVAWLLMRGRVRTESGGRFIQEPLMYATNSTVQAYTHYDRLNVAPTEELTSAHFAWRQAAVSISISGLEELQNSGESAVFNLLKAKVKVAEMSLKEWLDEKIHAAGASKDLTKDFLGLDELVESLVTGSQSTVGGIARSTNTWWANKFVDKGDASSSTTALTNGLNNFYNTVTKGLTQPDLIMTDQIGYEKYEDDNRDKLRLRDTRLMEVGFQNLKFKNATMMWNENIRTAPAGSDHSLYYFLNSEFLGLVIHPKRNFAMSNFVSPYDQDAKVAQILLAGNMTVNNSRFQGSMQIQTA